MVARCFQWTGCHSACLGALFLCLGGAGVAAGDVFHMENGGRIEGQLLSETDSLYRVRTFVGEIELKRETVTEVERGPSIFDEYDEQVAATETTPAAEYELALWCEEHGLGRERLLHLQRALELDSDYTPARRALGFVRVGDVWVEARSMLKPPRRDGDPHEVSAAAIAAQYEREIRRIIRYYLRGEDYEQRQEGQALLEKIDDPLALRPLFSELTDTRDMWGRLALVRAIARFDAAEATDYLIIAAIEDGNENVRQLAAGFLKDREPARVAEVVHRALSDERDWVVRRAATLAGEVGLRQMIPDLIDVLAERRDSTVQLLPAAEYRWRVGRYHRTLAPYGYATLPAATYYDLAGLPAGTVYLSVPTHPGRHFVSMYRRDPERYERRAVNVYRTEVRDALIRLSGGEDFGFDAQDWENWWETEQASE